MEIDSSRREFLTSWAKKIRKKQEDPENTIQPNNFEYPYTRRQFLRAAKVGGIFLAAEAVTFPLVKHLKTPVGNSGVDDEFVQDLIDNPVKGILEMGVLGPLMEEPLFRVLPSAALDELKPELKGQYVWGAAIPTSALFALAHGVTKDAVPIYQFAGGFVHWKMVREGGFPSSFISHSTHNSLLVLITYGLSKIFGIR